MAKRKRKLGLLALTMKWPAALTIVALQTGKNLVSQLVLTWSRLLLQEITPLESTKTKTSGSGVDVQFITGKMNLSF